MTCPGCRLTLLQTSRWYYTGTGTDICEAINMDKHFEHIVAARIVYEYVAGARRVHNHKRLWKKIFLEPSPSRADGAVCSRGQTSWDPGVAPKLCSFTAVYGVFKEVWCTKAQSVLQDTVQEYTEYRLDYTILYDASHLMFDKVVGSVCLLPCTNCWHTFPISWVSSWVVVGATTNILNPFLCAADFFKDSQTERYLLASS